MVISKDIEYVVDYINNHFSSDEVFITTELIKNLIEFRRKVIGEDTETVSDVIWSKNIPLKDFIVVDSEHKNIKLWRFCFIEDCFELLDSLKEDEQIVVGAIYEYKYNDFVPMAIRKCENDLKITKFSFDLNGNVSRVLKQDEKDTLVSLWVFWHSIQIALLHPTLREVFSTPKMVKEYERRKDSSGKRKRYTYYIRRHYVNEDSFKNELKEFTRHCLSWYVIGHWRHLKNGKTVFVKGHWKGKLRNLRKNQDDGRERKIIVDIVKD